MARQILVVFWPAVRLPARKMCIGTGIPDQRNTGMSNCGRSTLPVRDSRRLNRVGHGSIREVESC